MSEYENMTRIVANMEKTMLEELGRKIGLLEENITGTYRTISKKIRETIEKRIDEAENEETEVKSIYDMCLDILRVDPQQDKTNQIPLHGEIGPLVESTGLNPSDNISEKFDDALNISEHKNGRLIFKGQAKIKGIIGKGLSYVSLTRQVKALRVDHSERDVIEAIIQSVDASLPLRSFLDSKKNIDIQGLLSIIKSACQETDTTTLFIKLSNTMQNQNESAVSFLIRMLEIKSKVLFSTEGSDVNYSEEQVQTVFLKGLENGLQGETIRTKFRQFLNMKTSDEQLLEKLSTIEAEENERDMNMMKKSKSRVHQVDAKESVEIGELRTLVTELTAEVKSLKAQRNNQTGQQGMRWGCDSCRERGQGSSCRHCFKCGLRGHVSRDCENLNDSGLETEGNHQ